MDTDDDAPGERMRPLALPATLALGMLLAGCAPQVEPYRYLALLPAEGVELDYAGPLDQREVWFAGDVPLRYTVERARYRLVIANDPPSVLPGITVALAPGGEAGLVLRPVPGAGQTSPSGNVCASYYLMPAGVEMQFGWSADCVGPGYVRAIAFDVADDDGAVVRRERLAFTLESSGWYVLADHL